MHAIGAIYSGIFNRMPYPIRVLLNLLVLPLVIAYWIPKILFTPSGTGAMLSSKVVRDQMDLPDIDSDADEMAAAADQARTLADAGDWDGLHDLIAGWERCGATTRNKTRLYRAGLIGARKAQQEILQSYEDCAPVSVSKIDTTTLDRLVAAQAERPDDHVLAAITARAAIEIGWAIRGGGFIEETSNGALDAMAQYFGRAEAILADFDPLAHKSPMLALVQHMLCDGLPDAGKQLRASYDAWRTLDPTDLSIYSDHAFKLLPRWFGSHEELEVTARQAASDTQDDLGAGAYAAFYSGVLSEDDGAVFHVDIDMLEDGIEDIILAHGGNQAILNSILSTLAEAGADYYDDHPDVAAKRKEIWALFERQVQTNLTALCRDVWDMRPVDAKMAIASVFAKDLEAGRMVRFGPDGVSVEDPTDA